MSEDAACHIIDTKTIRELLGYKFFIPNYQRGYRWSKRQVVDLLEDIFEFTKRSSSSAEDFYCIQPLVVKKIESESGVVYEVVDGQQRLTTIKILLTYLEKAKMPRGKTIQKLYGQKIFDIDYQNKNLGVFFDQLGVLLTNYLENDTWDKGDWEDNIDKFYMVQALQTMIEWFDAFEGKSNVNSIAVPNDILTVLTNSKSSENSKLGSVQFIWYEIADEDPITVFSRLNMGKIPLTNAELVKAVFLNSVKENERVMYVSEWDMIENHLQSDEFWLFMHPLEGGSSTRIDFIFNIIKDSDLLSLDSKDLDSCGKDNYATFRYFTCYLSKEKSSVKDCWDKVVDVFQVFNEWFCDRELYHYIGFLVACKMSVQNIFREYCKNENGKIQYSSRSDFKEKLKQMIRGVLKFTTETDGKKKIMEPLSERHLEELNYNDEDNNELIKKVLLLHNIETVVQQGKNLIKENKYKQSVFYKFPFYLFKKESWDVEHVDSQTANDLNDLDVQKEWLIDCYPEVTDEALKQDMLEYISGNTIDFGAFEILWKKIYGSSDIDESLDADQKHLLYNLVLLDSKSNRGYHNDIFSAKRRKIAGKIRGKQLVVEYNVDAKTVSFDDKKNAETAFVPPCTQNVFVKFYTPLPTSLRNWNRVDAACYLDNIKSVLKNFLVEKDV